MRNFFLLILLLISTSAQAAIECKTVDTSGYDQEHKNWLHAATYRLVFEAGENLVPTSVNSNSGEVCFDSPTVDLDTVLSDVNVVTKITQLILDAQPTPAKIQEDRQENAKLELNSLEYRALLLRAFADITKDEINALRQWITDFKADVAAANNIGELKTRVAANDNLPGRTLAQLRTAIENKIDSGEVDS